MRVGILAAGIGQRLDDPTLPPKVLLPFGGETLLSRHVALLRACGVRRIDVAIGHRAADVAAELARIGAGDIVTTRLNPDYLHGSVVSFWTLREAFTAGEPAVFMDGDVLYDQRLLARLLESAHGNGFLMDRTVEEDEEPVKLCLRDGRLVDFHKRPTRPYDWWGEWVGFSRLDAAMAGKLWAIADRYVRAGRREVMVEDAIRDLVLGEPPGTFAIEDITGLPWIEIDFPEDLRQARHEVYPRLLALPADPALPRRAGDTGR